MFCRPASATLARGLKAYLLLVLIACACLAQVSHAQREEDEVVRITTNLVQVDAVILDASGRPVTDLRPDEVQIYEDGRPRKVTNFAYVPTAATPERARPSSPAAPGITAPPARLRPEDVRRAVAVVVDDLGLSFQSAYLVRRALRKFVDEQMRPGDLVAVIRTSGGAGALQQFTDDKQQLYAAVEAVKWYPGGRSGATPFAPIEPPTPGPKGAEIDEKRKEQDQFREDLFAVGTLGAIGYVVRGLRELPGRKSVLVISDGFSAYNVDDPARANRATRRLQQLIDEAARASVVIHTVNASGLLTTSVTAADALADANKPTGARDAEGVGDLIGSRGSDIFAKQSGLDLLAERTGGTAVRNNNDLSAGIRRAMDDQGGYYLVGYQPDAATFEPAAGRRPFHRLSLKVTRPGRYKVRMRDGFFGVADAGDESSQGTPRDQLTRALLSPFGSSGIRVQLTSLFANDAEHGSFARSTFYVAADDLVFKEEADGWRVATFDVVTVTFDEGGRVVDQDSRTDALRLRGEAFEQALKYGFVYTLVFPVKKPGAYQLRSALLDRGSGRVGSAGQFVEIPDLKKGRLALSGLALSATAPGESAPQTDPHAGEAVRHFRPGMLMHYGFVIYNARPGGPAGGPSLQVQARLFRGGQPVFTGKVQPFALNNPRDMTRLAAGGSITLGADLPPGEYVLQVTVEDLRADEAHRSASQWMDFEIVK